MTMLICEAPAVKVHVFVCEVVVAMLYSVVFGWPPLDVTAVQHAPTDTPVVPAPASDEITRSPR